LSLVWATLLGVLVVGVGVLLGTLRRKLVFDRDDVPFTVTWPRTGGLPTVTRDFAGFWQLAEMEARSRIHGGIHYQFDSDASQSVCPKVTDFAHSRFMRPLR